MKNILIIADGILAKKYLEKIKEGYSIQHNYYVVYYKESTLPQRSKSVHYYNFDPTSYRKLSPILLKYDFHLVMIILSNKIDTIATIDNIRKVKSDQLITVMDRWGLDIADRYLQQETRRRL